MLRRPVLGVCLLALGLLVLFWRGVGRPNGLALADIPQGVSGARFDGRPTFVVRHGARIDVFLTDVHHLPGENELWWCPQSQLFAAPTHGEAFDLGGRVVGGPSRSGLDRLGTTVVGERLEVDPQRIISGEARRPGTALSAVAETSDGSFCPGALHAPGAPVVQRTP